MTRVHDLTRRLQKDNGAKIVLLVADGLGGALHVDDHALLDAT